MMKDIKIFLVLLSDNDFEISSSIFSSCGADKILKKPFKFSIIRIHRAYNSMIELPLSISVVILIIIGAYLEVF